MARRTAEQVINELAAKQHGVVGRRQLLREGLTRHLIDHRLQADRLRALHRGVYQVGPVVVPKAWAMAAVLACGPGALSGGWSAAALWELIPRAGNGVVEVVVVRGRAGPRPGIRVRRSPDLRRDERTTLEGIPITTAARTLCDIAAEATDRDLERAVVEAFARTLVHRSELSKLLARREGRPGTRRLLALFGEGRNPARTRSEAEEQFHALIRQAGLPVPEVNARINGYEVDFVWPAERLIVEVDGRAFHGTRGRFEADRQRDRALVAAGYRVMRVTWRQIVEESHALVVSLSRALTTPAPR